MHKILHLLAILLLVSCEKHSSGSSNDKDPEHPPASQAADSATSAEDLKAELIDRTRAVMKMRVRENLSAISEEIHAELNQGLLTIFADKELLDEFTSKGLTDNLSTYFPNLLNEEHQAKLIDNAVTGALKDIYEQDDKIHRRLKTLPSEIQISQREEFSTEELNHKIAIDLLDPIRKSNNLNLAKNIKNGSSTLVMTWHLLKNLPKIKKLRHADKITTYVDKVMTKTKNLGPKKPKLKGAKGGPIGIVVIFAASYAIDEAIKVAKSNQAEDAKRIFTDHARIFSSTVKDSLQKHLNNHIEQLLKCHE